MTISDISAQRRARQGATRRAPLGWLRAPSATGVLGAPGAQAPAHPRAQARAPIDWLGLAIQVAVSVMVITLVWAVTAGGLLGAGTQAFGDWYAQAVVPLYATGDAVID